jgi:hypothetical protein
VVVCSYYKSGTNWALQIALQIAHRGNARFEHIHDLVPWPEVPEKFNHSVPMSDDAPWKNAPTGLRIIKTHLPADRVPYVKEARYLCVVRDPKDVFVSSYFFTKATYLGPNMPPPAIWLDRYLSPMALFGSWALHASGYWQMRHQPNVLFVTYESMKADLPAAVDAIARLMSVTLSEQERTAVLQQSSFSHMKSSESRFDPKHAIFPWSQTQGTMLRRGETGSASELLSPTDRDRIDDHFKAELRALNSDLPYDQLFALRS